MPSHGVTFFFRGNKRVLWYWSLHNGINDHDHNGKYTRATPLKLLVRTVPTDKKLHPPSIIALLCLRPPSTLRLRLYAI